MKGRIALCVALVLGGRGTASAAPPSMRPNVILIVMDALRADRLSLHGNRHGTSPNIDALARNALVCDHAYAQAPWTPASMASLFTGLYQSVHQVTQSTADGGTFNVLSSELVTLAEMFKSAGYATAAYSSQPWISGETGFDQGFDEFKVLSHWMDPLDTEKVVLAAMRRLAQPGSQPLFLYLHVMNPHDPYAPPPPFDSLFWRRAVPERLRGEKVTVELLKRRLLPPTAASEDELEYCKALYDEEIAYVDFWIGILVRDLVRHGILANTVLVLTGDHGEGFLEHGRFGHTTLDNEILHIPLVVSSKRLFPAPRRLGMPVESIDLLPTLAEALGLALPPQSQGRSLLSGKPRGEAYSEGKWLSEYKLQTAKWSLLADRTFKDVRLFDLTADPGEKNNVVDAHAEVRHSMLDELLKRRHDSEAHPSRQRPDETPLDPETLERLKALGYVQ